MTDFSSPENQKIIDRFVDKDFSLLQSEHPPLFYRAGASQEIVGELGVRGPNRPACDLDVCAFNNERLGNNFLQAIKQAALVGSVRQLPSEDWEILINELYIRAIRFLKEYEVKLPSDKNLSPPLNSILHIARTGIQGEITDADIQHNLMLYPKTGWAASLKTHIWLALYDMPQEIFKRQIAALHLGTDLTEALSNWNKLAAGWPEKLDTMQQDIEKRQKEIEAQKKEIEAQRKEREAQKKARETLQKEIEAQKREVEAQQKEIEAQQKEIEELQQGIETQKEEIEKLPAQLKPHQQEYNFVGLSAGFFQLAKSLRKQKAFNALGIFGSVVAICLWPIMAMLLAFSNALGPAPLAWYLWLPIATSLATSELVSVYLFRVVLLRQKSLEAQLLQVNLRMQLCAFVESYATFAKDIKKDAPETLNRFEDLIFSGIAMEPGQVPSAMDGMGQVAPFIQTLQANPKP